jgi:hypothetical protein
MTTEKNLDKALEAALTEDGDFRLLFLSKLRRVNGHTKLVCSRSNHPWGKVRLILANPQTGALEATDREGETGVLVVFENPTGHRLGVHVENKLKSGKFTSIQPELYAARAEHWVGNANYGAYHSWETVLLAPNAFAERNSVEAKKFTSFLSHEEVGQHVPAFARAADA